MIEKAEEVSVVAGGWSFSQVGKGTVLPGKVIAVNDAAIHLPRCDFVVSMDRLWTEYRWRALLKMDKPTWIRRSALKNVWRQEGETWGNLHPFECDHEESVFSRPGSSETLNGTNSGHCALNLAHKMRPTALYLFGFDMARGPKGESHWYPSYPWAPGGATKKGHYRNWTKDLDHAAQQFADAGTVVFLVGSQTQLKFVKSLNLDFFKEMANDRSTDKA